VGGLAGGVVVLMALLLDGGSGGGHRMITVLVLEPLCGGGADSRLLKRELICRLARS
jgi:hypothetical protein